MEVWGKRLNKEQEREAEGKGTEVFQCQGNWGIEKMPCAQKVIMKLLC